MEGLQHFVVGLVDHYGYFGLFVALALGNIGAPIGSEIVLPVSGALTATGHLALLWMTIGVAVAGELAGESIAYAVGRYGGVPAIERFGKYVGLHHSHLARIHAFFERYGTFAIFLCRFLPVIRGIAGFPAGVAEMNVAHFYLWTFAGSLIFCGVMIGLGFALGDHLDAILPLLHRGGIAIAAAAVVLLVAAVVIVRARSRRRAVLRVEGDEA
ncbi:MAG: DedA family protein [Candidatus Eremiobacteraeota bacterium]|nr:DedA family protein [Candidatus Eremiobacteraeota bacterium]